MAHLANDGGSIKITNKQILSEEQTSEERPLSRKDIIRQQIKTQTVT